MFGWLGRMLGMHGGQELADNEARFIQELEELRQRISVIEAQELDARVASLESRLDYIEESVTSLLNQFGKFKQRTVEELRLMESQLVGQEEKISCLLDGLEEQYKQNKALMNHQEKVKKFKLIRKRLRYQLTCCQKSIHAQLEQVS